MAHGSGEEPGVERLLELSVREVPGALILAAAGEIDVMTAPRFRTAISQCLERAEDLVVIDLVQVSFMGSTGLAALVAAKQESDGGRNKAPMRLVVDQNRPVVRPLEVTGIDHLFPLYHSLGDALAV